MKTRLKEALGSLPQSSWIGTFHGICNRLLRQEIPHLEIDGLRWARNFTIFDTDDSLALYKELLKARNYDEKTVSPRNVQAQISSIKNQGLTAREFSSRVSSGAEERLAELFRAYEKGLNENNALDFDDLLSYTHRLFGQQPSILAKYQRVFRHILVDEFQDTNQVQYSFIKSLVHDAGSTVSSWTGRSLCVVGDIDQSIYSWRGADYKIALNFERDFRGTTLIKLEHNYRSSGNILSLANALIEKNSKRIPKSLLATKGTGETATCFEAADELEEGNFIASEIKRLLAAGRKAEECAILYRVNSQSRPIEESLLKNALPYQIVGGLRFYDRQEIKDLLAYLRLVFNSKDGISLKRVINAPRRGIGASTVAIIEEWADRKNESLFGAMSDLVDSAELAAKTTKSIHEFVELIFIFQSAAEVLTVPELLRKILEDSGYLAALQAQGNEEAEGRIENIYELLSVAQEYQESNVEPSLEGFLGQVALVGDSEHKKDNKQQVNKPELGQVTLMTVHAAKGLEFPFVFITGLEEGMFPHMRSLGDDGGSGQANEQIEEERRLLYVALTRAEEKLYLSFARRRRLWGVRDFSEPSRFLAELPQELLKGYWGGTSQTPKKALRTLSETYDGSVRPAAKAAPDELKFASGDQVTHKTFGAGTVKGIFGGKSQKFYVVEFKDIGKKLLNGSVLSAQS